MATDVKNKDGGDTGNSINGRTLIRTGRAKSQTLSSPGESQFTIAGFDTSPPGAILMDRLDNERFYSGDTPN